MPLRSEPCCDNVELIKILTPDKQKHYAKQACKNCGAFWKWLPNPEKTIAHENRKIEIDDMLPYFVGKNEKISKFLNDMREQRFMSPAQFRYYNNVKGIYQNSKQSEINLIDL